MSQQVQLGNIPSSMESDGALVEEANTEILSLAPYGAHSEGLEQLQQTFEMSVESYTSLFVQSMVLNALVTKHSRKDLYARVAEIIEANLRLFHMTPLDPEVKAQQIERLIERIEEDLTGTKRQLSAQAKSLGVTPQVLTAVHCMIDSLIEEIGNSFATFVPQLNAQVQASKPDDGFAATCRAFLDEAHNNGFEWSKAFAQVANHDKQATLLVHQWTMKVGTRKNNQIETLAIPGGSDRYILFRFSPETLDLPAFLLLAFKFFHEYISHLNAGYFDPYHKHDIRLNDRFIDTPVQLSEGWMLHTARTFFDDNALPLLRPWKREHLGERMKAMIFRLVGDLVDLDESKPASDFAKKWDISLGYELAQKFLLLLQSRVFSSRAQALKCYYQFSFEFSALYMPDNKDFHALMMKRLNSYLHGSPDDLANMIQSCMTEDQRIELLRLWELMTDRGLEPNFPGLNQNESETNSHA